MAAPSQQHAKHASSASEPIIEDITELCDFCVTYIQKMLEIDWEQLKFYESDIIPGMCRCCELITQDQRAKSMGANFISSWDIRQWWTSEERRCSRICAVQTDISTYAVWADPGSAACAKLNDRAPILGPHINQVAGLTQHWLKMCSTHDECPPLDDTLMPTRVLALCGDQAQPSVQLVGSKGQQGRYIALSHCWGSTGKRPLRTTSENLEAHRNGISFEDLPKTFQDCVQLSQDMGIKYVWIDSLCIVQDDLQDWGVEAARMRDVYRNAAVVVAASGAEDSSEGLFITNRSKATIFRLPYRIKGEIQGTFNMMRLSRGQWDLDEGPLERRAWTLQERYLARRFLAFMPHGISWICKGTSINEAGCRFKGYNPNNKWFPLLEDYTRRALTVPSDRPEAMKGIAEEFQGSRNDRYMPEYGVWEEELVRQLLWLSCDPQFDDGMLPSTPSWSWVATRGMKSWPGDFWFLEREGVKRMKDMPERLVITHRGDLHLAGHLSTKQPTTRYVSYTSTIPSSRLQDLRQSLDSGYRGYYSRRFQDCHVVAQDMHDASHQAVIGLVRFDHTSTEIFTHVCFLAKHSRYGAEHIDMEEQTIGDVVYYIDQDPEFWYWALALEQISDSEFRRVGMGTFLPVVYQAMQVQVREFEII